MSNETSCSCGCAHGKLSKYCPASFIETFFDARLKQLQKLASPALFELVFRWIKKIGNLFIYPTLLLGLIIVAISSIRSGDYYFLLRAVIFVLFVVLVHYAAIKIFRLNDMLIGKTTEKTGVPLIFTALGFICAVGGALLLIGDLCLIGQNGAGRIFDNITRFIFMESIALIAFNFRQLNISEDENASISESALSVLAFIAKALVPMSKVIFTLFTLLTFILMIRAIFIACSPDIERVQVAGYICISNAVTMLIAVGVPIIATLAYLAVNLIFSLWRAILSLNANK